MKRGLAGSWCRPPRSCLFCRNPHVMCRVSACSHSVFPLLQLLHRGSGCHVHKRYRHHIIRQLGDTFSSHSLSVFSHFTTLAPQVVTAGDAFANFIDPAAPQPCDLHDRLVALVPTSSGLQVKTVQECCILLTHFLTWSIANTARVWGLCRRASSRTKLMEAENGFVCPKARRQLRLKCHYFRWIGAVLL